VEIIFFVLIKLKQYERGEKLFAIQVGSNRRIKINISVAKQRQQQPTNPARICGEYLLFTW
jgi:hypothetical protein